MKMSKFFLAKYLSILLLALIYTSTLSVWSTPSTIEILELKTSIGTMQGGVFLQRQNRTFYPGEEISVKITLKARTSSQTNNVITLSVYLVNPLGIVIFDDSKNITLTQTGIVEAFELIFTYSLPETALRGYYKVYVQASAVSTSRKTQVSFFYNGYVDRENIVELNWTVTLTGQGEVKELKIALPWILDLKQPVGPIISPKPSKIEVDPYGNRYAVYQNIKVTNTPFTLKFRLVALQEIKIINESILLSALKSLPDEVKPFLKPSPYIESDSHEIAAIASSMLQGTTTINQLLAKIADYVSTEIKYNAELGSITDTWQLGALWALHSKQGTCLQFARLYVAIARAAGLPARVVSAFDLKPPEGESNYLHAYAEVYVPRVGWIPIEPQFPGRFIGTNPPVPGYLPIVKGLGEGKGSNLTGVITFVYTGTVDAELAYAYKIYPSTAIREKVSLKITYPRQLFFNDTLTLQISTIPPDAKTSVTITAPNGTSQIYSLAGTQKISLVLDDTGNWTIEALATREGYFPTYYSGNITVLPRPLKVEITPSGSEYTLKPVFIIKTTPKVPNATIHLTLTSLLQNEYTVLHTNETGIATYEPLIILGPTTIKATVQAKGYETSQYQLSYDNTNIVTLYASIAIGLIILTVIMKHRKEKG